MKSFYVVLVSLLLALGSTHFLVPANTLEPQVLDMATWTSPARADGWLRVRVPEDAQFEAWVGLGNITYQGSDFVEIKAPAEPGWYDVESVWLVDSEQVVLKGKVFVSGARVQVLGYDKANESWYQSFFAEATQGSVTDQQRFIALNAAVASRVTHQSTPSNEKTARGILEIGSGWCGDVSLAFATIARSVGYPARILNLEDSIGQGHIVAEVMYDGRWHLFDADYFMHYVLPDGSVAGFYDILLGKAELVREQHDNGLDLSYMNDVKVINYISDSEQLMVQVGQWPPIGRVKQ